MPTSLEHLLPAADETVRCADHARAIDVDPGGTAIRADRVVVVPTPLPWPKPALDHPSLVELASELQSSPVPTRLLAAVIGDSDGHPSRSGNVIVYDRSGPSAVERHFSVEPDRPDALVRLGRWLARTGAGDGRWPDATLPAPTPAVTFDVARPTVLICTQGSHDVCCGADGARLAGQLEERDDLLVIRVSHTGGHRFAPTAMFLPTGRMWAHLDVDAVDRIVATDRFGPDLLDRCRGWWGADPGPAQMAERAVLAELGWALDGRDRTVDADGEARDDGTTAWIVDAGSERWRVEVELGREVPTIACRQPGGRPAKTGREYRVRSIERRQGPALRPDPGRLR